MSRQPNCGAVTNVHRSTKFGWIVKHSSKETVGMGGEQWATLEGAFQRIRMHGDDVEVSTPLESCWSWDRKKDPARCFCCAPGRECERVLPRGHGTALPSVHHPSTYSSFKTCSPPRSHVLCFHLLYPHGWVGRSEWQGQHGRMDGWNENRVVTMKHVIYPRERERENLKQLVFPSMERAIMIKYPDGTGLIHVGTVFVPINRGDRILTSFYPWNDRGWDGRRRGRGCGEENGAEEGEKGGSQSCTR